MQSCTTLLVDVDGESVYASTGSDHVVHQLKASQAWWLVNVRSRFGGHGPSRFMAGRGLVALKECSTFTVGGGNVGVQ